jgi:hypothetical protein
MAVDESKTAYEGLSAEKIAALDHTSIDLMASTPTAKANMITQAQRLHSDPNLRNKLNEKQINALNRAGLGVNFD